MARVRLQDNQVHDLKLRLIFERSSDEILYNQPTVSEVAALIVGDVDTSSKRDIIMETQSGKLKRIDELRPSYLAYQYPLIFPYGENGYRQKIAQRETVGTKSAKQNRLTIGEWLAYRIMSRDHEAQTIMRSRR
ncbi:uncharacterized protein [Cicer arietinum]|uniref:uncharacterized protein n=1 Tax=Cicer arietinum TaxID=3827 RepID=UPI003CC54B08